MITARDSQGCDGGMYGINPGSLCESKGTFLSFPACWQLEQHAVQHVRRPSLSVEHMIFLFILIVLVLPASRIRSMLRIPYTCTR